MSTLHQTINSLASEFAHSLLRALRGASLDEILAETASGHSAHVGHAGRRRGRPAKAAAAHPAKKRGGRRLHRRTAKQLEHVVAQIVALVKANKKGLRAEEIRTKLHLERREVPRPLGEALKKKLISKKGKKRATTYYA